MRLDRVSYAVSAVLGAVSAGLLCWARRVDDAHVHLDDDED